MMWRKLMKGIIVIAALQTLATSAQAAIIEFDFSGNFYNEVRCAPPINDPYCGDFAGRFSIDTDAIGTPISTYLTSYPMVSAMVEFANGMVFDDPTHIQVFDSPTSAPASTDMIKVTINEGAAPRFEAQWEFTNDTFSGTSLLDNIHFITLPVSDYRVLAYHADCEDCPPTQSNIGGPLNPAVQNVPEPTALALLAAGIVGLGLGRKKRR